MYKKISLFILSILLLSIWASPVLAGGGGILTVASVAARFLPGPWSFIVMAVLIIASVLLAPKPKRPGERGATGQRDRTREIQTPVGSREIVYGEQRKSGNRVFVETTSDRKFLHMIIVLASHEIQGIDEVFLDDAPIHDEDLDDDNLVNFHDNKFNGKVRIKKHLGADDQTADEDLVSEVTDWTTNHRLRGIAYLYIRLDNADAEVFSGSIPNVSAWVRGKIITETRSGPTSQFSLNSALILRDYLVTTTDEMGMGFDAANEIDDTFTDSAANICDQFVTVTDVAKTVNSVKLSTDDTHKGTGVLDFADDTLIFQTGDQVDVTSTGSVPTGLGTGLYAVPYRRKRSNFLNGDIRMWPSMQFASSYANAVAGTVITLTDKGSGTITVTKKAEPRYTTNGVVDSEEEPNTVVEELLSPMGGRAVHIGGLWRIYAAGFISPTISLDENDLRDNMKVQTRHSRRERFNAVKGTYISPINNGVRAEYPPITNATYKTEDNEIRIWRELDLDFVSRAHQAQRLAKIALEKHRQQIRVEYPTKLTGYQLQPTDTVQITNTRMGWTNKEFEVIELTVVPAGDNEDEGAGAIGIDLSLSETASTVYDWAAGEETVVDAAPNTNLPDPFKPPLAPGNLTLASGTSHLLIQNSGDVISRIFVSWTDGGEPFRRYTEVQFRNATIGQSYITASSVVEPETSTYILDVKDGDEYDVRVRNVNDFLVKSDYTEVTGYTVIGKTELPPNPINLFRSGDFAIWEYPDKPVDHGGFIVRTLHGRTRNWAQGSNVPEELIQEQRYDLSKLGNDVVTFMLKSVDTSDNRSTDALFLLLDRGAISPDNLILTFDEHGAGFLGTITNGTVSGGDLVADNNGTLYLPVDDAIYLPIPGDLYLPVGANTYKQMTYDFTFTPDVDDTPGTLLLTSTMEGDGWQTQYRRRGSGSLYLENGDELYLLVGTDLYLGGPGPYTQWPGSLDSKREKYDIRLITEGGSRQGKITELLVKLDVPDITESFEDVALAAAGTKLAITQTYRAIDFLGEVTIQDTGTAVVVRTVSMDKSGPVLIAYDDAGVATTATIDIHNMKGH